MKKFLSLFLCLGLAACVGTSKPSSFYNLQQVTDALPVSNVKLNIGVEEVSVPSYLDRPQIVITDNNAVQLNLSELNRWSESLSTLLQRLIADDVGTYLPQSMVKPKTYSGEGFNYIIYVELNKFDGSWNQQAYLDAWWTIMNADSKVLARERSQLSAPLGEGYQNYAMAQSRLVGELSRQIAEKISRLRR